MPLYNPSSATFAYFSGYMTQPSSTWTRTNTAFGNVTTFGNASTLVTGESSGLGTVSQFNTAGNYYPAILVTPTVSGRYEVIATVRIEAATSSAFAQAQLYDDTAGTALDDAYFRAAAANESTTLTLTNIISLTAATQKSLMIRLACSAGAVNITTNAVSTRAITWSVKYVGL